MVFTTISLFAAAQRAPCQCGVQSLVPIAVNPGLAFDDSEAAELRSMMHAFDGRREFRPKWKDISPSTIQNCTICSVNEDVSTLAQHLGELTGTQLFIDDYVVASAHGVERFIANPEYHPKPVMTSLYDFEAQGRYGFGYPGSVNHNGTHFIMHYIAGQASESVHGRGRAKASGGPTASTQDVALQMGSGSGGGGMLGRLKNWLARMFGMGGSKDTTCKPCGVRAPGNIKEKMGSFAVAVSRDGFDWTHRMPLHFYTPKHHNGGEHCVLNDMYEQDPTMRWKMVHNCNLPTIDETCLAYSADGIKWISKGHKWGRNADRQACLYHDGPGRGYDYMLPDEFPTEHSFRDIRGVQLNHVGEADFRQSMMNDNLLIPFKNTGRWHLDRNENEKVSSPTRPNATFAHAPAITCTWSYLL